MAITRSASCFLAYLIARSITPFSSGFGKGVVGKFGSGRACSVTSIGLENLAFSNTLTKVFIPTPWSAVYTILRLLAVVASFAVAKM